MPKKRTDEAIARELTERPLIAARLREARAAAGYKGPTEAAAAMNVNYQTYAGHENANRSMSREKLAYYAKFLGVKSDFLLYGFDGGMEDSVKRTNAVAEHPKLQIVGTLSGDSWKDSAVPFVQRAAPIGPINGHSGEQVCYEMLDASFNEEILPGSLAVCLITDKVREGDCVIIENTDGHRHAFSARCISAMPDGTLAFHFRSSQPSFNGLPPLKASPNIKIIGRIIGTYRRIS